MTGEVCLDDDKFGQMGSQQRPNHQIRAVGWPQSEISSIGGGVWTTIGYELGVIWEMSVCYISVRRDPLTGLSWSRKIGQVGKVYSTG